MATESPSIEWSGASGLKYRYFFLRDPSGALLLSQPGNYMFVRQTNPEKNWWLPVYIGIADDLKGRVMNHEIWEEALRCGATHLMAHLQSDRGARETEERDLIGYWNPVCNTQHRTVSRAG